MIARFAVSVFLMLLAAGSAAAQQAPGPAAPGQPGGRMHRVGVLTPAERQWEPAAFREALRVLGHVEGANLAIEVRSADAGLERLPEMAQDLVRRGVDVIVAVNTPGTRAALGTGTSIPIVMAAVGDPVALGFVSSLARPGGNVTGMSNVSGDLAAKRLALFKEAVPSLARVVGLYHPDEPIAEVERQALAAPARNLGIDLRFAAVRTVADLEQAFRTAEAWRADGIFRLAGQSGTLAPQTIELAARQRLPLMALQGRDVKAGALLSYFSDNTELFRRVAAYVHRILHGARPGDLPIEQPTRFELIANLKTARALGLAMPDAILARADEVIE